MPSMKNEKSKLPKILTTPTFQVCHYKKNFKKTLAKVRN